MLASEGPKRSPVETFHVRVALYAAESKKYTTNIPKEVFLIYKDSILSSTYDTYSSVFLEYASEFVWLRELQRQTSSSNALREVKT